MDTLRIREPSRSSRNVVRALTIVLLLGLELIYWLRLLPPGGILARLHFLPMAVAAAATLAFILVHIEYGILLLPVVAAAVPLAAGTGTASPLVASLLLATFLLFAWISRGLVGRDLVLMGSPINLPLAGFVLTAILATINSRAMLDPLVSLWPSFVQAQIGGLSVLVISGGVLVMVMNSLRELRWVRWLVWTFLAIGAADLVGYLIRSHTDLPGVAVGGMFSLWVIVLALGQALFNGKLPRSMRVGLLILAVGWFYRRFAWEFDWLSGWMPAAVAVLVLCLLRSRKLFVSVLVGLVVVGTSMWDQFYSTQVIGNDSDGNFLRVDLWEQNFEVTKNHLMLGTGMAGYASYYMTYFPTRAMSTHSNYLDIFAQTGVIGSLLFVWFLIALFRVGLTVRGQWPTGFAAGFANGALAGLAGLLVALSLGDWFIPFVYNQTIAGFRNTVHSWVFLGVMASLRHIKD